MGTSHLSSTPTPRGVEYHPETEPQRPKRAFRMKEFDDGQTRLVDRNGTVHDIGEKAEAFRIWLTFQNQPMRPGVAGIAWNITSDVIDAFVDAADGDILVKRDGQLVACDAAEEA